IGPLARELAWHLRAGRLPRIGVRSTLARVAAWAARREDSAYPDWLSPDFERAHRLKERWREGMTPESTVPPPRGSAHRAFASPVLRSVVDPIDPGNSGVPLEHRHPLLDLRIVRFALSLPPVPWCVDKELFRARVRGVLPREVSERPKAPLAGDP